MRVLGAASPNPNTRHLLCPPVSERAAWTEHARETRSDMARGAPSWTVSCDLKLPCLPLADVLARGSVSVDRHLAPWIPGWEAGLLEGGHPAFWVELTLISSDTEAVVGDA